MRNFIISYITFTLGLLLTSCNPWLDVTVYGKPGTQIINPATGFSCTTIGPEGEAKISVDRTAQWYPFMLSYDPSTKTVIPFGLDYERSSKNLGLKWTGAIIGIVPSMGITGLCMSEYNNYSDVFGQYDVNKKQQTNQDIKFESVKYNTISSPTKIASTQTDSSNKTKKNGKKNKTNNADNDNFFTHTVRKGETINSIAEQYEVKPLQIINWNKLTNSTLHQGQSLKILIGTD